MIEVNGMAHIILTVGQWEKARVFYGQLCPFLGMHKVFDGNKFLYHVGGRTALGIQRCADEFVGDSFQQNRIGLHHLCFRARTREDVDLAATFLRDMGAFIDRGPMEGSWAPGYYFFVFEISIQSFGVMQCSFLSFCEVMFSPAVYFCYSLFF